MNKMQSEEECIGTYRRADSMLLEMLRKGRKTGGGQRGRSNWGYIW